MDCPPTVTTTMSEDDPVRVLFLTKTPDWLWETVVSYLGAMTLKIMSAVCQAFRRLYDKKLIYKRLLAISDMYARHIFPQRLKRIREDLEAAASDDDSPKPPPPGNPRSEIFVCVGALLAGYDYTDNRAFENQPATLFYWKDDACTTSTGGTTTLSGYPIRKVGYFYPCLICATPLYSREMLAVASMEDWVYNFSHSPCRRGWDDKAPFPAVPKCTY